jgi:hypothetical protein
LEALSRNTAICSRVTDASRQKTPGPQPAVMPRRKIDSTYAWKMSGCGTSRKSENQA